MPDVDEPVPETAEESGTEEAPVKGDDPEADDPYGYGRGY